MNIHLDNILPKDGTGHYYGKIMEEVETEKFFHRLLEQIAWKNDEARIFGKHFVTGRKVAWYGDRDFAYTYSNTTRYALDWTDELLALKSKVEQQCGEEFNSCLLNLYHHGMEGMAWHSDDEKSLEKNSAIACLSFGAERKFSFKHRFTKQKVSLVLEKGSLLLMKGTTQQFWLHSLPKTRQILSPRISLTFRMMEE